MAYYRRSREPENVGQNIDVFRPLPSLHQQHRQRKQTGILPQFGFSDTGASSYHHQAPARERLTAYVNVNGINATNSFQKRATSVFSDDEETPPKRGRGRPPKNQNVPPYSYSRRSTDRDYNPGPTRNYYHQAYSRDNRSAERNFPARNGRRSADRMNPTRARSREFYNRDHSYADNQRGRSQGFEADVKTRRSTRSTERQLPKRQPRRSTERFASPSRRSVEAIDSPQQPVSSGNVQTAAPTLQQTRPVIRSLENKEPSIASMVLRLYNPSNHNFHFAPSIFAYPSIRENVNGLNTIGNIIDAAGKYKEQKRGKKF